MDDRIYCEIEYTQDMDDSGVVRDCVVVSCGRCGHETTSWGHGTSSVKRCLALLREECPMGEENFYVEE